MMPCCSSREWVLAILVFAALFAAAPAEETSLPTAKYTLSCNIEIMFPQEMPPTERLEIIAAEGLTAYSFWHASPELAQEMATAAKQLNLTCGSISGTGDAGWSTGLTKPGAENRYLEQIKEKIEIAQIVGCQNLICFVGQRQADVPVDQQRQQIVAGLRKAGDLAEKADLYIVLEPLSRPGHSHMTVLTAKEGFDIIEEVNHPHVKLDFDMFHLQLSEGNLINNLRRGLEKGWIRFVEVGDVPGRLEPGTGEVNYQNIFSILRELGYDGYIGMEHGTSSTPQHAIAAVKKMAFP